MKLMILALFAHVKTLAFIILTASLLFGGFFLIQKTRAAWSFDATPPAINSINFDSGSANQVTFIISGADNNSLPGPLSVGDTQTTIDVVATNNSSLTPTASGDVTAAYSPCTTSLPSVSTQSCYRQSSATRATTTSTGNRTVTVLINQNNTNLSFFTRIKQDEAGNTGSWNPVSGLGAPGTVPPVVSLEIRADNTAAFVPPGPTPTISTQTGIPIWLAWTVLNGATSCTATSLNTRPPGGSVATWNGAVSFNPANLRNIGAISVPSRYSFTIQCSNGAGNSAPVTVTADVKAPPAIQTEQGDVHTNEQLNQ